MNRRRNRIGIAHESPKELNRNYKWTTEGIEKARVHLCTSSRARQYIVSNKRALILNERNDFKDETRVAFLITNNWKKAKHYEGHASSTCACAAADHGRCACAASSQAAAACCRLHRRHCARQRRARTWYVPGWRAGGRQTPPIIARKRGRASCVITGRVCGGWFCLCFLTVLAICKKGSSFPIDRLPFGSEFNCTFGWFCRFFCIAVPNA